MISMPQFEGTSKSDLLNNGDQESLVRNFSAPVFRLDCIFDSNEDLLPSFTLLESVKVIAEDQRINSFGSIVCETLKTSCIVLLRQHEYHGIKRVCSMLATMCLATPPNHIFQRTPCTMSL